MADRTKPQVTEEVKNGGTVAPPTAPADEYRDMVFAAPVKGVEVGESYLYRPGDQPFPGVFSSERDKQGRLVNGVQAGKSHCGWLPLQGYLVRTVGHEAKGEMKAYDQLEIMLTAPCVALDGEKIRRCKTNDFVLVKASGNLKKLMGAAQHPTILTEMYLCPTGEFVDMKDADKLPMRKWKKVVVQQIERKLVNVPRLPAARIEGDADDDDFDPRRLEASRPELRS